MKLTHFNSLTLVCLILLRSNSGYASSDGLTCVHQLEIEQSRKDWQREHFSNPHLHESSQFTYLIHAIDLPETADEIITTIAHFSDALGTVSLSLVDQNYVGTFMRKKVGFIVEVPPESILASHYRDMIDFDEIMNSELKDRHFGLHRRKELMALTAAQNVGQSTRNGWNEVRARRSVELREKTDPSQRVAHLEIQISGLFYRDGVKHKDLLLLRQVAVATGLPLVFLKPSSI